jgi:poly(3-hydroxybutyrate) depolymerase
MILIIQCFSVLGMIDNNRVFITGYSAGGDGIYHVASMMADYLAGAAMMAGHPNRADVYNLRNIAFSVQVG